MSDLQENVVPDGSTVKVQRNWKDFSDGTHAPEVHSRGVGLIGDTKETDPDQDATAIALLKGILEGINSLNTTLTALNAKFTVNADDGIEVHNNNLL